MKLFIFGLSFFLISCTSFNSDRNEWLIDSNEVFDGGPGKDGIPSVDSPQFEKVSNNTYMNPNDLVIGIVHNNKAKAYPHRILDWHEIINDEIDDIKFALTYCPLTGTGSVWNRVIDSEETTFGVSGKLYNSNLIPYDRRSDSNWSQLRLDCINGELIGDEISTYAMIETTWETWTKYYPSSDVMTLETGFSRDYNAFPYGDYRTNHTNIIFPVNNFDTRLAAKERVLAVITEHTFQAFSIELFETNRVISISSIDENIIVIGSKTENFITAFHSDDLEDVVFNAGPNFIAEDANGNKINLSGKIVEGPLEGTQLVQTKSILGYFFAIGAFYPDIEIFE